MDQLVLTLRDREWIELIKDCNNSQLTRKEWCRENHVSVTAFYYHQKRIRAYLGNQVLPEHEGDAESQLASVPLAPSSKALTEPTITIKTGNLQLELTNNVSEQLLTRLIEAITHTKTKWKEKTTWNTNSYR